MSERLSFLGAGRLDEATRAKHDATHRPEVVLAVLAMLLLYGWLFTPLAAVLGLPSPRGVAAMLGITPLLHFDHGMLDSRLRVPYTELLPADQERLLLLLLVAGAFLSAYFSPLPRKRAALLGWFLLGLLVLYGWQALCGLLFCHLLVYLLFHPPANANRMGQSGLMAGLLLLGSLWSPGSDAVHPLYFLLPPAFALFCRFPLRTLLDCAPLAAGLRKAAIWSTTLVVLVGAIRQGALGETWTLPLYLLLFCWYWERLMMYDIDYRGGLVPRELSLVGYLSLFLSPASLLNCSWGVDIGQGYSYTENNFYATDKNRIVLEGVRLWGAALIYLVFGNLLLETAVGFCESLGVPVFKGNLYRLSSHFTGGGRVDTASVILTCFLEQMRYLLVWAGVLHVKVGIWRVCGYRFAPYYDHPWLATNLVVLYTRFTFYYREFLVRVFYYPVFFRLTGCPVSLRIFLATFAAVALANMLVGHLPEQMFFNGMRFENIGNVLIRWPYFFLLAAGITVAELWLMRHPSRRKPWTPDRRFVLDLLAMYATWHFYAVIHVFAHMDRNATLSHNVKLFLIAWGWSPP
ncbi:MAG: hypothetical protein HQL56_06140 [Magnetococcales bacterium]|nr:hypothetical protein [Magnetococcales bacterium]